MTTPCPLCDSGHSTHYCEDKRRVYQQCSRCHLVFVEPHFQLSAAAEKAQYDLHQNSPEDSGYRQFLSRFVNPLLTRLTPASQGLDFGSGPGPTLSLMLADAGHPMALFDIFYANHWEVLTHKYRFITATEVVEHLSRPGEVLQQLWQQLEPGGLLALMTKLVSGPQAFAKWHYKNDPTHISFFCRDSFQWLGQQWQTAPEFIGQDVIFFTKPGKLPANPVI